MEKRYCLPSIYKVVPKVIVANLLVLPDCFNKELEEVDDIKASEALYGEIKSFLLDHRSLQEPEGILGDIRTT